MLAAAQLVAEVIGGGLGQAAVGHRRVQACASVPGPDFAQSRLEGLISAGRAQPFGLRGGNTAG